MRTLSCGLVGAVVCAVSAAAFGQRDPPSSPVQVVEPAQGPTFRTGVDLVSIDVGVVDRGGRPVEDLRAADFAVRIDGETRRVVAADLVKVDVEAARAVVADKSETFFTSNLTAPEGRQIVIAVDQVNIRPGSLAPVMAAAARFLDKLSPLDQVAFVAYPEPGPRVNFTNDRLKVRLAMQSLVGLSNRMPVSQINIGVAEAIAVYERRDSNVLAEIMARECPIQDPNRRLACERDVIDESSKIAIGIRERALESLGGLRLLLQQLTTVDGPKSLILISEGLAFDDASQLDPIVILAGIARTSINIMLVDVGRGDVTISRRPPTESEDRRIQNRGLEGLAFLSRGSLFHVTGTGEPIFDRLASEISAYYLLGVEQRPGDRDGERHRIDVEVRRRDVTIRSRQAFVLSPAAASRRSADETLRDALLSPFAVSGVPLRVTTFAQQDGASGKVRLMVAAQVGAPGTPPGKVSLAYLVINDQNRVVSSFTGAPTLAPMAGSPNEPLEFLGEALVDPGVYSLRFAVVDGEGRRGSVVREVNAWKMDGEELALGDLVVGNTPASGQGIRASVEPFVTSDSLAMYLELYSTSAATWERTSVAFDVASEPNGAALTSLTPRMAAGQRPSWRVATGVLGGRLLPPGRYVARVQISRDGKIVGSMARPFVLEPAGGRPAPAPAVVAAAAVSFAGSLPKFAREAVLARGLVSTLLDIVETRSPLLKEALVEARAGRYGAAALEALGSGDQTAAAFLRGMDFYTRGQIDQAATQFDIASGPRREFFPAAFYLGAAFAEGGRDRDAAGVWQLALGTQSRPSIIYTMVADARLRDGQPQSAIDVLKPAYEREPLNDDIARRLGMAYMLTGRHADAVPVLEGYLARQPTDEDALFAVVVAHYELARGGQTLSTADRGKLRRFAAAYRGPQQALVEKYLQTIIVD